MTIREVRRWQAHRESPTACALAPDESYALTASWEELCCWNPRGELQRRRSQEVRSLTLSSDGQQLAAGGNRKAWVEEIFSEAVLAELGPYGNTVEGVAFSADGRYLATASHDGTVRVFAARPLEVVERVLMGGWGELQRFCLGAWVNDVAFCPQTGHLTAVCRDGTWRTWNPLNARQLALGEGEAGVRWPVSVAYSPAGRLALGWSHGSVTLDGRELPPHGDWVRGLAWQGEALWMGSHEGNLACWRDGNWQVRANAHHGKPVYALSCSAQSCLSVGWDGEAALWTFNE